MAKTKKIIQAGPYRQEVLMSRGSRYDSPKQRAAKQKASSEAQRRMNLKNSTRKLTLLLMANFPRPGSGNVVTVTFAPEHRPRTRKQAKARFNSYKKRLRAEYKERGVEMRIIDAIESAHDKGNYHFHFCVTSTGDDYEILRRCWIWGDNIEIRPLQVDKEKNWETLARYMNKEAPEHNGEHVWSCTRNCIRPEIETFVVPDDTQLQAPAGSVILQDAHERTEFASWQVLAYLLPNWDKTPRVRAKKRRKHGRT